jgi:hypothetical protein
VKRGLQSGLIWLRTGRQVAFTTLWKEKCQGTGRRQCEQPRSSSSPGRCRAPRRPMNLRALQEAQAPQPLAMARHELQALQLSLAPPLHRLDLLWAGYGLCRQQLRPNPGLRLHETET